jgi:hypothetical protein
MSAIDTRAVDATRRAALALTDDEERNSEGIDAEAPPTCPAGP